jgi:hypothetical protein
MYGGCEVVVESGKRQVERANAAADLRFSFEDLNLQAGLRKHNRRGKAIRA